MLTLWKSTIAFVALIGILAIGGCSPDHFVEQGRQSKYEAMLVDSAEPQPGLLEAKAISEAVWKVEKVITGTSASKNGPVPYVDALLTSSNLAQSRLHLHCTPDRSGNKNATMFTSLYAAKAGDQVTFPLAEERSPIHTYTVEGNLAGTTLELLSVPVLFPR